MDGGLRFFMRFHPVISIIIGFITWLILTAVLFSFGILRSVVPLVLVIANELYLFLCNYQGLYWNNII
jgi:hypothetical protein